MTACGAGEQLCEVEGMEGGWGAWGECQSPDQREEVCFDEIDQDCDGVADEGCEGCMGEVSFLNEQAQIVLGLNADIQSAYVGTYAWIALSRKDQGTPIMLNRLDHAGVANEPNTFRVGIPVSVFDWSGGVGLLSVHQGRLGFSRHSSSDNSALFEEIYMGSNSALNSTIALGNQALYLIWSEVLEELHLQKVNTQGEVIMNSIQLTDAIGRSFQPSAVVSSQGLRIAFVDERDQDPTGWWIYVLEWSPNQPLAPPQSYQFLQGEDPKLLWSRGIYTLVYVLRTQEVSEVRLVQWDQERQVLRAPQVLYRSIGQVQKLKLIPTMEGYQVGWVVYVDQKYHFKVLHTDEDGEPTQEMVHVAELPNQPDYDFAITDSKALVSWTDRYPELEDLLFEPVLKLNAMEITTECLSQVP